MNYFGAVAVTQTFLPLVRASKGRIINVSSIAGLLSHASFGTYASSKFALEGFSDSLRKEVRPLGVAVVLVNPGVVVTKIIGKIHTSISETGWTDEWLAVYGRFKEGVSETIDLASSLGATTAVTDAAIVDGVVNPRPQARYFVANTMGIHVVVLAFLARVVPAYLVDVITLLF